MLSISIRRREKLERYCRPHLYIKRNISFTSVTHTHTLSSSSFWFNLYLTRVSYIYDSFPIMSYSWLIQRERGRCAQSKFRTSIAVDLEFLCPVVESSWQCCRKDFGGQKHAGRLWFSQPYLKRLEMTLNHSRAPFMFLA